MSFYLGTVGTSSDTLNIYENSLLDSSGAKSYKGWKLYFTSGAAAGSSRYVQDVDLLNGKLILNRALSVSPGTSSSFWLLRDFSRGDWLGFFNQSLRNMKKLSTYVETAVSGRKIALPAGVDASTVVEVRKRQSGSTTDPGNYALTWYGFDYIAGTAVLRSEEDLDGYDLLWDVEEPYATNSQNLITLDSDTVYAPRDWLVGEAVALALATLWSTQVSDADIRRVEKRVGAAGRLVAGLRSKYSISAGRRLISSNPM